MRLDLLTRFNKFSETLGPSQLNIAEQNDTFVESNIIPEQDYDEFGMEETGRLGKPQDNLNISQEQEKLLKDDDE